MDSAENGPSRTRGAYYRFPTRFQTFPDVLRSWKFKGTERADSSNMKAETVNLESCRIFLSKVPDEFPLGARGARPVKFLVYEDEVLEELHRLQIPGVLIRGRQAICAWDAAPEVAIVIGADAQQVIDDEIEYRSKVDVPLPGLARYRELGLHEVRRDYQAEDIRFLVRLAYGILGEPPRAGKCLVILSLVVLVDAKRVLIVCNSLGKLVWAEEIAKWLKEDSVIYYGRSGTHARIFCRTCLGSTAVDDPSGAKDADGYAEQIACPDCKAKNGQSLGERILRINHLRQQTQTEVFFEKPSEERMEKYYDKLDRWREKNEERREKWRQRTEKKKQEWGKKDPARRKPFVPPPGPKELKKPEPPGATRRQRQVPVEPPTYVCPDHPDEIDTFSRYCLQCRTAFFEALEDIKFHIMNYDITTAQKDKDDQGATIYRDDLPGWGPVVARLEFDFALASEGHRLRGWESGAYKGKQNRRERINEICHPFKRAFIETGTPTCGNTRDLWGLLDFVSRGLFS